MRGGGGNFGVVTVFEYRVDPVGPIVLGGNLVYPADRGLEVISAWQELVDSASDDLGTGIHFYVMPDIPYVPAELRNQPVVSIFMCHAGTVQEAEREIAPLRELAPAADMLEPMPYTTVQALSDAVLPPGQRNYWKAENLTDLTTSGDLGSDFGRRRSGGDVTAGCGGAVPQGPGDHASGRRLGRAGRPCLAVLGVRLVALAVG